MLKDDIRKEFNEARKQGNALKKAALESVIALILQKEKTEAGKVITDAEVLECVSKEIKVQREIKDLYATLDPAQSADAAGKVEILLSFLPKQLSDDEVTAMIKELDVYEDASPKTKGMIIKALMPKINGLFDKSKVNPLVEEYLSKKSNA